MSLRRVFIANRGEIAQRIVRACQAVGAESVACSPADDAASLHCVSADRAVRLPGAGPAAYLDAAALVRAAVEAGADALHPGIGFLSESPQLARLCDEHGVRFVGPSADALARRTSSVKDFAKILLRVFTTAGIFNFLFLPAKNRNSPKQNKAKSRCPSTT